MTSVRSTAIKNVASNNKLNPLTAQALAAELEGALKDLLAAWLPRCVDKPYGGFLCDFDYRWKASGPQHKMLEYQARMTRLIARVAAYPGLQSYRELASLGFAYLHDVLWDREYGGWFRMLSRTGAPLECATKHGHGMSYAIGACAAYYELTSDSESLARAKKGLQWLDRFAHDDEYGGYFALYLRDGTRISSSEQYPDRNSGRDCIGTPFGLKDANTNADMLEAVADLYRVCPDTALHKRLLEMVEIVRDRMIVPPGAVHMYFQADWTPVPDFNRYGYGLNTANILARSCQGLAPGTDGKTAQVIKSVVDTLLRYGWDQSKGGFFYGGSTFGPTYVEDVTILIDGKFWWLQAEGLRALLRMALLYPDDEMQYFKRFKELWDYIKKYMIDWDRGGWLRAGLDSAPARRKQPKATPWKEPSHEVHSILECLRLLKGAMPLT
jgi:mannobiose 2-epimerase